MDVGAAGALNLRTTVQGLNRLPKAHSSPQTGSEGQEQAIVQALAATYPTAISEVNAPFSSPGSLSAMAGSSNYLGQLVNGVYAASVANGNTSMAGLDSTQAAIGGQAAATARDLLTGAGPGSMDGFSASTLSAQRTLALAAYADIQDAASATRTASASAAAVKENRVQPSSLQAAMQAAQMTSYSSLLNLLG